MPRGVLRAIGLASSFLLLAGCLHAPVLWSPDGRWLAYTIAVRPGPILPAPGWILQTDPGDPGGLPPRPARRSGLPRLYRLWATRVDTGASVLLEESRGPLTSPAWAPDGRSLAFGRLVPEGDGRVRFEVVLQDGPDHQRVLLSRPHGDFNERAGDLPALSFAWSPDGRYLAIPWLQQTLDLAIVRTDNGRVIKVIDGAYLPAWSPDGTKLAFVRGGDAESLYVLDSHFGQPKLLADIGQTSQSPVWSRDGQSLIVVRHPAPRGAEAPNGAVMLARVRLDSRKIERIANLSNQNGDRDKTYLGASFGADRDGETLFFSSDVEGEPTTIAWFLARNGETLRKFHPIDHSIRVGALAVSPVERLLALRVGSPGYLSPPGVVDLSDDRLPFTPFVPDDSARVEWLTTYIDAARGLLLTVFAPDGPRAVRDRASLLPVPGELDVPELHETMLRLKRLGRMGRPLCDRPADAPTADPALAAFLDEARLFFDYLRQDYDAALGSLDRVEAHLERPDQRLRLLSVRAQALLGQGDHDGAEEVIDFLRSVGRPTLGRYEETPAGPRITPDRQPAPPRAVANAPGIAPAGPAIQGPPRPPKSWHEYLSRKVEEERGRGAPRERTAEEPTEPLPLEQGEPPVLEIRPGAPMPFAPDPGPPPADLLLPDHR